MIHALLWIIQHDVFKLSCQERPMPHNGGNRYIGNTYNINQIYAIVPNFNIHII
jgi:hypothetical protein